MVSVTLDRFKAICHKLALWRVHTLHYEVLVVVQAKLSGSEYSGASKVSEWGNSEQVVDQVRIAKLRGLLLLLYRLKYTIRIG